MFASLSVSATILYMNNPTTGPKDFFLWVAATVALIVSVVSLLSLWFELIDRALGTMELSGYVDPYSTGIRVAVASLIVIFPLYLYFMRALHQDIRRHAEKRDLWVRRWLLVASLFVAGITLVIDLIVLINAFLGGEELTAAFLLKILSIFVVVGGAFMYYVHEIKGTWEKKESLSKTIGALVVVVVVASIVGAFYIIGSPREQRLMRYDYQKVNDLQSIQWQVTDFYQQKERLPESLDELKDPLRGTSIPLDPQVDEGMSYTYRKTAELTFELCAVFNTENMQGEKQPVARPVDMYVDPAMEFWQHRAGEVCFERTVDPEKFPPYNTKETVVVR